MGHTNPRKTQKFSSELLPGIRTLLMEWKEAWEAARSLNINSSIDDFGHEVFGFAPSGNGVFRKIFRKNAPVSYQGVLKLPTHCLKQVEARLKSKETVSHQVFEYLSRLIHALESLDADAALRHFRWMELLRKEQPSAPSSSEIFVSNRFRDATLKMPPGTNLRVPHFQGRNVELGRLKDFCFSHQNSNICAVYGETGKTQLLAEFLHRFKELAPKGQENDFAGGFTYVNFKYYQSNSSGKHTALVKVMNALMRNCEGTMEIRESDDPDMVGKEFEIFLRNRFRRNHRFLIVVDNVPGDFEFLQLSKCISEKKDKQGKMIFICRGGSDIEWVERHKRFEKIIVSGEISVKEIQESLSERFSHAEIPKILKEESNLEKLAMATGGSLHKANILACNVLSYADSSKRSTSFVNEQVEIIKNLPDAPSVQVDLERSGILGHLSLSIREELGILSVFQGAFSIEMAQQLIKGMGRKGSGIGIRISEYYHKTLGYLSYDRETQLFRFSQTRVRELVYDALPTEELDRIMPVYCKIYVNTLRKLEERITRQQRIPIENENSNFTTTGMPLHEVSVQFHSGHKADVLSALHWAATVGLKKPSVVKLFRSFLLNNSEFLSAMLSTKELYQIGRLALELLRPAEESFELYYAKSFLADASYRGGLYANSEMRSNEMFLLSNLLARKFKSRQTLCRKLKIHALWDRGRSRLHIWEKTGKTASGNIKDFEKAEKLIIGLLKHGDGEVWKCRNHAEMGWALMRVDRLNEAAEHLRSAVERSLRIGLFGTLCRSQIDLGRCFRKLAVSRGDPRLLDRSKRISNDALSFAEAMGSSILIALAHRGLSRTCEALQLYEEAIPHEQAWLDWKLANGHYYPERTRLRIRMLAGKMHPYQPSESETSTSGRAFRGNRFSYDRPYGA